MHVVGAPASLSADDAVPPDGRRAGRVALIAQGGDLPAVLRSPILLRLEFGDDHAAHASSRCERSPSTGFRLR